MIGKLNIGKIAEKRNGDEISTKKLNKMIKKRILYLRDETNDDDLEYDNGIFITIKNGDIENANLNKYENIVNEINNLVNIRDCL